MATAVGSVVIEETLASGEMLLLLGSQPGLERRVLIRKLSGDLLDRADLVDRFRREARFGARVHHPNVVAALDAFAYRGDHYLVLEYVDGPDLRAILDRARRIPTEIALSIALEVTRGLEELHAAGVTLANLTPERILVSRWGEAKICGLSRAREQSDESAPEISAGPYTAPEVSEGELGEARADLYSLGALLEELLRGEPPFQDGRPGRLRGVPSRLARIVASCRARDPRLRPESVAEVRRALELALKRGPSECRAAIAGWLYREGILKPPSEQPEPRLEPGAEPAQTPSSALEGIGRVSGARWRWTTSVAAIALLLSFAVFTVWSGQRGGSRMESPPIPPVSTAGEESPARIRFVVHPWAEVEVEGHAPFLTPRAEPVSLAPGDHEVEYRHPRLGTVRRRFHVDSGEERVIRELLIDESAS